MELLITLLSIGAVCYLLVALSITRNRKLECQREADLFLETSRLSPETSDEMCPVCQAPGGSPCHLISDKTGLVVPEIHKIKTHSERSGNICFHRSPKLLTSSR